MKSRLLAAVLAAVIVAAPVMAFAQTEVDSTSTYSDTMPKKPRAHAAKAGKQTKRRHASAHRRSPAHMAKHRKSSRHAGKTAK
jgi:Ni/Co efflux regulator RcnB